jgi:CYTH domain-containing protein
MIPILGDEMAEIEKKFRLRAMPGTPLGVGTHISQGYVFTEGGELRVRKKGDRFFITVKGEGSLSREEWETQIPAWVFETIWPKTQGRRVEKIRYSVPYSGLTLELDEYFGRLQGLMTLEIEFSDVETASKFSPPEWVAITADVTADTAYKNKSLAVFGLPV